MKRKLFFGIVGVTVLTLIAAINVRISLNSQSKIDLVLANTEALAQIECIALDHCGTNCPYEFCGYCSGYYMLECPKI